MGGGFFRRAWDVTRDALTLASVPTTPTFTFTAEETPPRPIDTVISEMMHGSGAVSRTEALSVPAVLRGRNMICGEIGALPLQLRDPAMNVVYSPLLADLDPDVENIVTIEQTIDDLIFSGMSFWRVTAYDAPAPYGRPLNVRHLDIGTVTVQPPNNGRSPAPLPSGIDPRGATVYVDGVAVPWSELIMFQSPNPGLLKVAGRSIRQAIALGQAAEMYANNPRPLDYFTPSERAGGVDPPQEYIDETLDTWRAARKKRSTAWVPGAADYHAVDTPTPQQLQLVELLRQAWLEIANIFGLDPEDVGVSTTSRTYQNAVDRRVDRINGVLAPYMRTITDRLSKPDITRRGYTVAFNLDGYLRADPKTRWENYKLAKEIGVMTVDEIRAAEQMPALTAAQKRELAPAPSATPDVGQADTSNVRPLRNVSAGATHRDAVSFDGEAVDFTIDVQPQQFAADEQTRTVEGIVVPYGVVTYKGGRRFRFAPGSLKFSNDLSRVKLLVDHDYSQAIGKLVHVEERPEGVFARFKVTSGPEGDRALALAADQVRDGFSVGVDITDSVKDPDNRGALLVVDAYWRETSLLAVPAYEAAHVTKVAASRDQGELTVEPDTAPTTAPVAPAAMPGNMQAAFEQFIASYQPGASLGIAPDPRPVIDPTRSIAMTAVTEAAPYTFDRKGNLMRGAHDFSSDLIAGSKGDYAALQRAETFMHEQFEHAMFDIDRTDASTLNPNRNRPDLYVDQLEYLYPVWSAISKGTLPDSTPFVLPKFNTAATLVANHTEGVEPSAGSFTATSQTITPTAVSGRVEITREAWDQGGNPQLSNLVWRQMVRAYYEALEAFAVSTLDAASPTAINISSPASAGSVDVQISAAIAALQFIRGGNRFDDFFVNQTLFTVLARAVDSDGRKLFPMLGPVNATGQARSKFTAIDVAGMLGVPSWALSSSNSYLINREDVSGWATAPQRLEFQYRVAYVDLAVWGYKAAAITRIEGVREVIYA